MRLNVQFNEQQQKTLDKMADELSTTKTGVLRIALSLLEVAICERREGNSIGIIKGEKVLKEIVGIPCF